MLSTKSSLKMIKFVGYFDVAEQDGGLLPLNQMPKDSQLLLFKANNACFLKSGESPSPLKADIVNFFLLANASKLIYEPSLSPRIESPLNIDAITQNLIDDLSESEKYEDSILTQFDETETGKPFR